MDSNRPTALTYSNIRVVEASGIRELDDAAVDAVKAVGRFESIPREINRDPWSFEVLLVYELK